MGLPAEGQTGRLTIRALIWGVLSSLLTATTVYAMTRDTTFVVAITAIEFISKSVLYALYENLRTPIDDSEILGIVEETVEHSADALVLEPCVIWFTGLPSSGKTTLCLLLKEYLDSLHVQIEHLDGDAVRAVVPGIGFTRPDRNNHIRRMGFLASRFEAQGISVIASFVSPYRESRDFVRRISKNFIEVYLSTDLAECSRRDVKGLYQESKDGKRPGMTGVDDPYEAPESPEITLDTASMTKEACIETIKAALMERGLLHRKSAVLVKEMVESDGPSLASRTL